MAGAFISGFFGNKIKHRNSEIITSSFTFVSAILSTIIFYEVITNDYTSNKLIASWINSGELSVNWSIKKDTLSSVMLVVVTFISFFSTCLFNWIHGRGPT